jgi:hypothetical protein
MDQVPINSSMPRSALTSASRGVTHAPPTFAEFQRSMQRSGLTQDELRERFDDDLHHHHMMDQVSMRSTPLRACGAISELMLAAAPPSKQARRVCPNA